MKHDPDCSGIRATGHSAGLSPIPLHPRRALAGPKLGSCPDYAGEASLRDLFHARRLTLRDNLLRPLVIMGGR